MDRHNLGRVKSFSPPPLARWTTPSKPPLPRRHPTSSTRTSWARALICSTTIRAYRARYHLFSGNYQAALDDGEAVDPTATSGYTYDAENENPLYAQVVVADDYAPRDHFGLSSTESGRCAAGLLHRPERADQQPQRISH